MTLPRFKQKRVRDRKYLDSYADATCCVCGSVYGVVGAHIRAGHEGGMGLKPDDSLTLPLCIGCHAEQEANPGIGWWVENVFKPSVRRRYEAWRQDR